MSLAVVVFLAYAIAALAGGALAIAARRPETALRGLLVSLVAGTCAYVQVMASAVAAVQLVMLAGAGVAALRLATGGSTVAEQPRRAWSRLAAGGAAGLALGWLAWILIGSWARQYVWTGRELPPGTRFGSAGALAQAWSEAYAPAMAAALLALLVVAIVGVAEREHRL